VTRARIVKVSALVAGAALALSGCGLHPGAAAVVDGVTISDSQVDDTAAALCSNTLANAKAQGQPKPALASRGARQAAVRFMVDAELAREFAKAKGITPPQSDVSAALAQNEQAITALPKDLQPVFRDFLRGYVEEQLILREAGRKSLGGSPTDEQAITEGSRLRQKWASSVDVEVDPRFGTWTKGTLAASGGSLSVPVSRSASAGANTNPSADWVSGLPASQTCG
jgi:hypothetical protein